MHKIWRVLFHFPTKGQMDFIERIQCKAIRLVFGYMRMTPKNVMLAEAKIPPITFRLKFLGSNYLTRALSNPHHLSLQQINDHCNKWQGFKRILWKCSKERYLRPTFAKWTQNCSVIWEQRTSDLSNAVFPSRPCWLREAFPSRRVTKPRQSPMVAVDSTKTSKT
jgi:hypothetical protein